MLEALLQPLSEILAHSEATMAELNAYWNSAVFPFDGKQTRADGTLYRVYPFLFLPAYPALGPHGVERLALAGRLMARAAIVFDVPMDRGSTQRLCAEQVVRGQMLQLEGYRLLHGIYPPESPFWSEWRRYQREYAWSAFVEQQFVEGERPIEDFDETMAMQVAATKAGLTKAAVAGLGVLSGDRAPEKALLPSIDWCNFAIQLWDDLADWRQDAKRGVPSLVLRRLAVDGQKLPRRDAELVAAAKRLYYHGHATYVIDVALTALQRSAALSEPVGRLPWHGVLESLTRRFSRLREDIDGTVRRNVDRAQRRAGIEVQVPRAHGRWQRLGLSATRALVAGWRRGFPDLRHYVRFPEEGGFDAPEVISGDVFQRAVVTDSLLDVCDKLDVPQLAPLIDDEATYLVGTRVGTCGAWSYWPELNELPPDLDTLAQVMQVVTRTRYRSQAAELCERAVDTTIAENAYPDGSYDTWMLVPAGQRTRAEERQARLTETHWGRGADPAVVANFVYALSLYDRPRFAQVMSRAVDWLRTQQREDGTWWSERYRGPFYPTFACIRAIGLHGEDEHVSRARSFILDTQLPGSGWGVDEGCDPLSTSLALLALTGDSVSPLVSEARIESACAFLETSCRDERSGWGAVPWIEYDWNRARTEQPVKIAQFGSATITTAYVAKAAVALAAAGR